MEWTRDNRKKGPKERALAVKKANAAKSYVEVKKMLEDVPVDKNSLMNLRDKGSLKYLGKVGRALKKYIFTLSDFILCHWLG